MDMFDRFDQAFRSGEASALWGLSRQIRGECEKLVAEMARLRFRLNFGTPVCDDCDGLTAGPKIVATCFQVKQCHYGPVGSNGVIPGRRGVLDRLMGG